MANVKKIYDMCAITGKYTNRNGEEKNEYTNIGRFFVMDDQSFFSVMKTVPVGNWDGKISYFEQKPKETEPAPTTTAPPENTYGQQSEVATPPPPGSDLPF